MTMKITTVVVAAFALMLLFLGTGCSSSAAEKLIHDGNEAFARQAFEEAWIDYQAAQNDEPELAEPYYNAANALYRQGKYEEALAQLEQALAVAGDESLAQRSFFNLGNTSFNLQTLEAAVAAYKEALLRNPDDQDAKYNLELALQQQEQQQQEQEQQQQQDQSGQDEQQQDPAGEGEQDQQQNGEQSQDQEGEPEQQSGEESPGEESPADQSEGEQQQEASQNGEGQPDEQQQDGQEGEQGNPDQPQAGQGQPQPGEQQQNNGFTPAPGQRMTAEQARELLAAIAQDSQTLQERLGQFFLAPERPSGQDW